MKITKFNGVYTCKCKKVFDDPQKFNGHKRWCEIHKGGKENINKSNGARWNKGLTKENNTSLMAASNNLKNRYALGEIIHTFTEDGLKRLSNSAKKRGLGGYRPHPNKGVWYKDTWFDSKWEERLAISLDNNNIQWERPKIGFVWTDKGNKYYPDFYLPDFNIYLDPKNSYLQIKDATKINEAQKRNNIKVLMLSENQLTWEEVKKLLPP